MKPSTKIQIKYIQKTKDKNKAQNTRAAMIEACKKIINSLEEYQTNQQEEHEKVKVKIKIKIK